MVISAQGDEQAPQTRILRLLEMALKNSIPPTPPSNYDLQRPVWFTLRNGSLKPFPKSFTEGSKKVRHLSRYLSIQGDPEFFPAYHH